MKLMTQKTLEKINQNIASLKDEMRVLHSLVIGVLGRDKEGKYRPEFTRKVSRLSKEKAGFVFKNDKSFLKQVRS